MPNTPFNGNTKFWIQLIVYSILITGAFFSLKSAVANNSTRIDMVSGVSEKTFAIADVNKIELAQLKEWVKSQRECTQELKTDIKELKTQVGDIKRFSSMQYDMYEKLLDKVTQ